MQNNVDICIARQSNATQCKALQSTVLRYNLMHIIETQCKGMQLSVMRCKTSVLPVSYTHLTLPTILLV
eukprot:6467804-Pyramimonas_sp.AAC.1